MNNNLPYLYVGLLKQGTCGLAEIPAAKTGYRRIEICPFEWCFEPPHTYITNGVLLSFPQAKTNWGIITDFGIWDSLIEGELLIATKLNNTVYVNKYMDPQFEIDKLRLALDQIVKLGA